MATLKQLKGLIEGSQISPNLHKKPDQHFEDKMHSDLHQRGIHGISSVKHRGKGVVRVKFKSAGHKNRAMSGHPHTVVSHGSKHGDLRHWDGIEE